MREIKTHHVNGLNEAILLRVVDEPGPGGANHDYELVLSPDLVRNNPPHSMQATRILFQKGPILEAGINGLSGEVLLAIVRDRLECFQQGPYACDSNELALAHVIGAMAALDSRTRARIVQGVEGKSQPHEEPAQPAATSERDRIWGILYAAGYAPPSGDAVEGVMLLAGALERAKTVIADSPAPNDAPTPPAAVVEPAQVDAAAAPIAAERANEVVTAPAGEADTAAVEDPKG